VTRTVVLGWGNAARGDDALGPALLERLAAAGLAGDVELVTDFQLQPEHVLDLAGRDLALFVDASHSAPAPFAFAPVAAARDASFSSHAMSPAALLAAFAATTDAAPPAAFVLAIRGQDFDFAAPLSAAGARHLDRAATFAATLLRDPSAAAWRRLAAVAA
jgi:hydrogenase maturation protease